MRLRSITEIDNELEVVRRIAQRNRQAVESSERPIVDEVFAASSDKRRTLLEKSSKMLNRSGRMSYSASNSVRRCFRREPFHCEFFSVLRLY